MTKATADRTTLLLLFASVVCIGGSSEIVDGARMFQPRRELATLNVCQLVPGEDIARALGGKLADARAFSDKALSRCTYFIVPPGSEKPRGYVVWMQPPEDFEGLKQDIAEPRTSITGLGDGAYMFRDAGDGRFKINVLKRGDVMIQVTGESADSARKVADAVVARLGKPAPN